MESVYVEDLTWHEYQEHIKNECLVFLPVGALEQHGPHLPMGTDAIFAEYMAVEVAKRLNGIVLPTIRYGYKSQARSGGGQTFPGTTSVDGSTLTNLVKDIIRELGRHGVKNLAVIDGHFENKWFLTEAIELAQREFANQNTTMQIIRTEYWDYTPQEVYDKIFEGPFPGVDLEHAALIETSMMLYLHPERVHKSKIPNHPQANFPPCDIFPQNGEGVPETGVLAPAGGASAKKGELIIKTTVDKMTSSLAEIFSTCISNSSI